MEPPLRVVGIGASAGGLDAFQELLEHLSETTGMAFVFVQHLARDQKSMLAEILSRKTRMPVVEVAGDTPVVANRVYVIPSFADMRIKRGVLRLEKRSRLGKHMPVDHLFRSLAEDIGSAAIGVVLSGTDGDGTQGAKAIKAAGGVTFAQDESAHFDGMPRSAIDEGVIDFRLSPREIAQKLSVPERILAETRPTQAETNEIERIIQLLVGSQRVDLAQYKTPTIQRRIERRVNLAHDTDFAAYRKRLETDAKERDALYRDVLIGVTRFFREETKINALKKKVFPRLLKDRAPEDPLRFWVPGCSTGEEAYSLAIAIVEFLEHSKSSVPVQIFATDVNEHAITLARAARYASSIEQHVSEERLQRFFSKDRDTYTLSKDIRNLCVFAQHDLLRNPPFSRIDLISCSNVLIYLQDSQQKRVIGTFRYALKDEGFLVLGPSESVGGETSGFTTEDRQQRIFRLSAGRTSRVDLSPGLLSASLARAHDAAAPRETVPRAGLEVPDVRRAAERAVAARFAPPYIVVNDALDVIEWSGNVQRFLSLAPGAPSFQLPRVVSSTLLPEISAAIEDARTTAKSVFREAVLARVDDTETLIAIGALPLITASGGQSFAVVFEEQLPRSASPEQDGTVIAENLRLRKELETAREYVHQLTLRHDAVNSDVNAASEELQSANEELQSTVEELETAKEELQSTNEELMTLNDELRVRNADLVHLGDDLMNLLGGIDTPVIMVDRDLIVRRFNPTAQKLLSLLGSDLGRPIFAFKPLLAVPNFIEMIESVVANGDVIEQDVTDKEGHWYSLRLRPYRTARNDINGVVITLVDVNELRTLLSRAEEAKKAAEAALIAAEQARSAATEANRLKDEFLSTLSHELRTPITSILGWAQMMRLRDIDDDTLALGMASIERATKAQIRLIDDLLDVSRITTGRLRLERSAVAVDALVQETLTVIRPAAESKSISVEAHEEGSKVVVRADPDRLRQVLWNLLINAVKFTSEGGSIRVTIEGNAHHAKIVVTDTGEGIAQEFLPYVFERFRQADGSSTRFRSGLGLGLAITRYLVELHGGTIVAESPGVGKGSTFTVTLPTYEASVTSLPDEVAEAVEDPAPLPSLSGIRVLVVDDDPDTLSFINAVLKDCGADVALASSAAGALADVRRLKPHVIVSDIAMPGQDGLELLRTIRGLRGKERNTPAIALTAYTSPEEKDRIFAVGFERYLSKPVTLAALATAIAQLAAAGTSREP